MSRREAEFDLSISKDNAAAMKEQGNNTKRNHGKQTWDGPGQFRLARPEEEILLTRTVKESQKHRDSNKK